MTAGVVEARQELKLRVRQPATIAFQLQRKRVAPMPEQKIARTGEHAHALELRAGDLVTSLAVRNVQLQYVGLGAQAQMLDNGRLQLRLGRSATGGHDDTRSRLRHSGMSRPSRSEERR